MFAKIILAAVPMFSVTAAAACAPVDGQQPESQPTEMLGDSKPAAPEPSNAPKYREHQDVSPVAPAAPASPPATGPQRPPPSGQEIVNSAAQDLARRLDVKLTQIEVLAIESVVWNDGSLGCPQPDKAYTMAQVPGLRMLFGHDGKIYQYHATNSGPFFYCPNPSVLAAPYATQ